MKKKRKQIKKKKTMASSSSFVANELSTLNSLSSPSPSDKLSVYSHVEIKSMYKKMIDDRVGKPPLRPFNLVCAQCRDTMGHEKFDSMRFCDRTKICTNLYNALSHDLKVTLHVQYEQKKKEYQAKIDSLDADCQELIREYNKRWYTNKSGMQTLGVYLNSENLMDMMVYLETHHEIYDRFEVSPASNPLDAGHVYVNIFPNDRDDPDVSWTMDSSDELTMNHIYGLMEKYGIRIKC